MSNSNIDSSEESKKIRNEILELSQKYFSHIHKPKEFVPGKSMIPVSGKVFDETELQFLISSGLDFWLTTGRFNEEFEKQLADFFNAKFCITTNSGSSANLLAISSLTSKSLGDRALKTGDEVLTAAAGFPTTVNPIIQNNLIPVFVDVDIPTYNIDVNSLEQAISEKTKAIILAHTMGNPFEINEIVRIAKEHNLWLIEDCCDALGSKYDGKKVGTFGDIATLSFYPAHHITMGEGGAVITNNPTLKRIIDSFRDWGRDCFCAPGKNNTCGKRFEWKLGELPEGYDHKYIYSHVGYNLKITDMQAAVGLAQLQKLPNFIEKRKENFQWMKSHIEHLKEYFIFPKESNNSEPAWFGFPLTIQENAKFTRDEIQNYLGLHGIDTRVIFAGNIIKQPSFTDQEFRVHGKLTNTDVIMDRTFWIGIFPGITIPMMEYMINTIESFVKKE